jgi:farnesyl-diphosphate farnesyltransferase
LSRLFAQSQLEEAYLANELYLSDQMGAFLQKTNIIRDYLEDYVEGRTFWPQTIWKKHSNQTNDLGYFAANPHARTNANECLHEMITDALEHVPACLTYLSGLQFQPIFRFCAIPQVMAMATLAKCYGNEKVFTGVVKIRKGLSCKLMIRSSTLDGVHEIFYQQAKWIERKAIQFDHLRNGQGNASSQDALMDACDVICAITEPAYRRQQRARLIPMFFLSAVVICQFLPSVTLLLLMAIAIWNYYFGPFHMVTDPYHRLKPSTLWLARVWNEVAGKKR